MYSEITANKRKTWVLIAIFTVVVLVIGYAFGEYAGGGYGGLVAAAVISTVMALTSYFAGDKIALSSAGATPIQQSDNPYVYRLVENLAITAGLPMPKVYLINDPQINAFATGRDPKHASIAVTTGAIEKLENEELEGVIAHELSHVGNYDIRLMTVVIVLVGLVSLLSNWFIRVRWYGGGRGGRDRNERGNAGAILAVIGLVLLIVAPLIGKLIQLAVSRKREFLADASGSLLTRYPEGLARALEKIGAVNQQPMRSANAATAHLYIASPFGAAGKRMANLFSTHPPLEERIKALRGMAER
ncbi:MAG: M48 family metallopeptidase [Patescibacteria group bacterium]|nr:M48 family metallopeptidase [Patescibacteria group bacterium]